MKAIVVRVFMKPEHRKELIAELLKDGIGSEKNEPGCLMFNIAQEDANPDVLHLFEVYRDPAAVETHTQTPHFLKFVEATKQWHAKPFEITMCTTVYPPDGAWQKRAAPP
jgi:quinol monooxygenase YgiN